MPQWTDFDITNLSYFALVGTQINTTGGSGSGAVVYAITSSGIITSLNIISGGSGYTTNFSPTITGAGSGASVTLTVAGGAVTGYTSLVGGTGYVGTAPAWRLNTATNPWSALLFGIANLHANINGNGMTISNLGGLSLGTGGSGFTLPPAAAGASQSSQILTFTGTNASSVSKSFTLNCDLNGNLIMDGGVGGVIIQTGNGGLTLNPAAAGASQSSQSLTFTGTNGASPPVAKSFSIHCDLNGNLILNGVGFGVYTQVGNLGLTLSQVAAGASQSSQTLTFASTNGSSVGKTYSINTDLNGNVICTGAGVWVFVAGSGGIELNPVANGASQLSQAVVFASTNASSATESFFIQGDINGNPTIRIGAGTVQSFANNAAAIAGGVGTGGLYRNGDVLQIVH